MFVHILHFKKILKNRLL